MNIIETDNHMRIVTLNVNDEVGFEVCEEEGKEDEDTVI
jgi:hypothetical protein